MDHWVVLHYLSGYGTLHIGDAGYAFVPGSVFIYHSNDPVRETASVISEKHTLTVNRMPYALVNARQPIFDTKNTMIGYLIEWILAESTSSYPNHDNVIAAAINLLFQYMISLSQSQDVVTDVTRVIALLHKNVSNAEFRVCDALSSFSLSEDYLRRLFKLETGKSPHEYLLDIRIDRACELLITEGDSSIKEIAGDCGFVDPLHFSRTFKRKTGTPPSEWKLTLASNGDCIKFKEKTL